MSFERAPLKFMPLIIGSSNIYSSKDIEKTLPSFEKLYKVECCLFQTVNGCFACCSPVETIFFGKYMQGCRKESNTGMVVCQGFVQLRILEGCRRHG